MRLKAVDQIHISAVQPDSLRPQQEFEVTDELGKDLLARHPNVLVEVTEAEAGAADEKAAPTVKNKAAPKSRNKAKPAAPARKAASGRKSRGK